MMHASRTIVSLFLICLLSGLTSAQPDGGPRATVDALFDGMRSGDSTAVRNAFLDDASMASILSGEDGLRIHRGSVDQFVEAVGTPHDQVWDERIFDVEIRIDGAMASVWAPYRFYLGDTISHCGVNQFILADTGKGWKILSIVDTRQKDC